MSFLHKKARTQSGKDKAHEVGGHEADDQNQMLTSSSWINHTGWSVHMKCYSRDELILLSYVYYIKVGRGGLKERGGLITFFPWSEMGSLLKRGA